MFQRQFEVNFFTDRLSFRIYLKANMHFLVGQYSCDVCHSQFFSQTKKITLHETSLRILFYIRKIQYSVCQKRGTKKKSECPMAIEPMTSPYIGRALYPLSYWETRGERDHIYLVRCDTRPEYCWVPQCQKDRV